MLYTDVYSPYIPPNKITSLAPRDASIKQWLNRRRWAAIRGAELFYTKALRKLAKTVGQFIKDLWDTGKVEQIQPTLENYSEIIEPWANSVAQKMITEVSNNDYKAWLKHSGKMAASMQAELKSTPIGEIVRNLRAEQVKLIKSIPLEAAKRVQELAFESVTATGERWDAIAKKIEESEKVTESRAKLIARTECTRAQAIIQEARARHIGSEGYIWKTMKDRKVRIDHHELEGQYFEWNNPPVSDKKRNIRANPGCIFNCRCYAEPVLPARFEIGKR